MISLPQRVSVDGQEILPISISRENSAQSEMQPYIKTLQCWLSCITNDYNKIPDGIWNSQMASIIKKFYPTQSSELYVSADTWKQIEIDVANRSPLSKSDLPKKEFSKKRKSRELWQNLKEIGIETNISTEKEIITGLQLYQALVRGVDCYLDESFTDYKESDRVYAELVDANPCFTESVWRNFDNFWGLFYGAPWLGIVTDVPSSLKVRDSLWCCAHLFNLLMQWGREYLLLMHEKGLLNEGINNPIIIKYIGNRLGGKMASRNDFSQIGMSAALDISAQSQERLDLILDALRKTDSAMRLRINKATGSRKSNLVQCPDMENSSVLEWDPAQQKLMKRPELIAAYLNTSPEYFDHYSLDRFALGVAKRSHFLQTEDLAVIFGSIKDLDITKLIFFLGKLQEYNAIGPILSRIDYEGENFLNVMLKIPTTFLGSSVNESILKFQHYLAEAYTLSTQLRDVGFIAATTKAKDLVTEILEENITT